jgi:nicotinamidase-related amidase
MRVDAIDPAKTAMIVVDMQNDFVAAGAPMETPAARAIVPKLVEWDPDFGPWKGHAQRFVPDECPAAAVECPSRKAKGWRAHL